MQKIHSVDSSEQKLPQESKDFIESSTTAVNCGKNERKHKNCEFPEGEGEHQSTFPGKRPEPRSWCPLADIVRIFEVFIWTAEIPVGI